MYGYIQYVLEKDCGILVVEPERYGSGFLVGIDFYDVDNSEWEKAATIFYREEISKAIQMATSPGDLDAMMAKEKLDEYALKHSEFLYVQSDYLDLALKELNNRCEKWKNLTRAEQKNLLLGFEGWKNN